MNQTKRNISSQIEVKWAQMGHASSFERRRLAALTI